VTRLPRARFRPEAIGLGRVDRRPSFARAVHHALPRAGRRGVSKGRYERSKRPAGNGGSAGVGGGWSRRRGGCARSARIAAHLRERRFELGLTQEEVAKAAGTSHSAVSRLENPMRVAQVHAAVEALLGEAMSEDSVSWCLSVGVHSKDRLFVRVARGGTCWRVMRGTGKAQAQRTQSSAVRRTVLGCVLRASPDKRPRRTGGGVRRRLQAAPGRSASLAAQPHRRHPGHRRSSRPQGLGPPSRTASGSIVSTSSLVVGCG
jgi:Helix-turn-helix domain